MAAPWSSDVRTPGGPGRGIACMGVRDPSRTPRGRGQCHIRVRRGRTAADVVDRPGATHATGKDRLDGEDRDGNLRLWPSGKTSDRPPRVLPASTQLTAAGPGHRCPRLTTAHVQSSGASRHATGRHHPLQITTGISHAVAETVLARVLDAVHGAVRFALQGGGVEAVRGIETDADARSDVDFAAINVEGCAKRLQYFFRHTVGIGGLPQTGE